MQQEIINTDSSANVLPLRFTESAYREIERLAAEIANTDESYLRIGVKGGGCSGMSYILGFDQREDDDTEYLYHNVKVVIKPLHLMYLEQMQIDYSNGLDARGFIFNNPNASSSCGCGSSFAV